MGIYVAVLDMVLIIYVERRTDTAVMNNANLYHMRMLPSYGQIRKSVFP